MSTDSKIDKRAPWRTRQEALDAVSLPEGSWLERTWHNPATGDSGVIVGITLVWGKS